MLKSAAASAILSTGDETRNRYRAALFVPQAVHIWKEKTAKGVSLLSFAGFNGLQAIGAVHGYCQGDRALMIGMIASLLTCGSVTVLAARYRGR